MGFERTVNIAGFDSRNDLNLMLIDVTRPITPTLTEQNVEIPGNRGETYTDMKIGSKTFEFKFALQARNENSRVLQARELSNFFMQLCDGGEYPVIFSEESDVVYYCHPVDISDLDRIGDSFHDSTFTIQMKCTSGTAEGEMVEIKPTESIVDVTPQGNAETYPIFTFVANKDIEKVGISDSEQYIYLGRGFDVENQDTPVNMKPRILYDPCTTLNTWTSVSQETLTFNLENGVIGTGATMGTSSSGNAIGASLKDGQQYYGSNVSKKWHGPCSIQWLNTQCENYKITVRFHQKSSYARAMGKIELYLLDSNGKRIGKIMLKDNDESLKNNLHVQIGYSSDDGQHATVYSSNRDKANKIAKGSTVKKKITYKQTVKTTTKKAKGGSSTKTTTTSKTLALPQDTSTNSYSNFYGNITLEKNGNVFSCTVNQMGLDGAANGFTRTQVYTDVDGKFSDALAGVAVFCGKYDITEDSKNVNYKTNTLYLADVRVWNILGTEKEIILEQGDELVINCSDNTVQKNGIPFMTNFFLGSDYLEMKGGTPKTFAFSPTPDEENGEWFISYKPRYN